MVFLEENGNNNVYKNLTKLKNAKINERWTFYLALCCFTASLGSFQFGYNIGSLNLLEPILKSYFEQIYFKELYFDKLKLFEEGKKKLKNGTEFYNEKLELFLNKSALYEEKLTKYNDAVDKQSEYMEVMLGFNLTKIAVFKARKELKEAQIRRDHNMTIEEFMSYAENKLSEGKIKLNAAEKKLTAGKIKLEEGQNKIKNATEKIRLGRLKLDKVGTIIWSFLNSMFIVGGLIGAVSSKYVLDYYGRKNGILFHFLFSIVGSLLMFLPPFLNTSKVAPVLVKIGRLLHGIQGGMSCSLIPTYLFEIAPATLRGQTGVFNTLFLTMGIFCAQILGLNDILGTKNYWNLLLSFPILPSILGSLMLIFLLTETPKYLLFEKKNEKLAIIALQKLRNEENVANELDSMYADGSQANSDMNIGIFELLKSKEIRLPLLSCVVLQLAQQFCGINAVFFYSRTIMEKAGFESTSLQIAVLLTGFTNVLSTFLCIGLVERFGRRLILIWSMIIIIVDLSLLTVFIELSNYKAFSILALVCIIIFIISYAVSLGPIPFIIVAEVFNQHSRSSAMSICVLANWTSNLVLTFTFPILIENLNGYVFTIFIAFLIMSVSFVYFKVPETKKKSPGEILQIFNRTFDDGSIELKKEIHV